MKHGRIQPVGSKKVKSFCDLAVIFYGTLSELAVIFYGMLSELAVILYG